MTLRLTGTTCSFALFLVLGTASGFTQAKGCIKGAVVGGAAGHMVGKHGMAWQERQQDALLDAISQ